MLREVGSFQKLVWIRDVEYSLMHFVDGRLNLICIQCFACEVYSNNKSIFGLQQIEA